MFREPTKKVLRTGTRRFVALQVRFDREALFHLWRVPSEGTLQHGTPEYRVTERVARGAALR
jgi:hypothetical protein